MPPAIKVLLAAQTQASCGKDVIDPVLAQRIVDRYVISFFETHLAGHRAYAKYLGPSPGVQFYDAQHMPPVTTTTVPDVRGRAADHALRRQVTLAWCAPTRNTASTAGTAPVFDQRWRVPFCT